MFSKDLDSNRRTMSSPLLDCYDSPCGKCVRGCVCLCDIIYIRMLHELTRTDFPKQSSRPFI